MNKKLIAAAVATAFAAPMAASADATIYGAIDTGVLFHELEGPNGDIIDNIEVQSYDGALGIKGSEDLGNGLTAIYKIEWNFDGDDGNTASGSDKVAFTTDEVWVGLAGDWGVAAIGREDHPYKNALNASGYNPFGDRLGDLDGINDEVGGLGFRQAIADNAVLYISPDFSGFSFTGAIVAPEGTEANGNNTGFDAYSLGANYKGGGLKVGAGYEDIDVSSASEVTAWFVAASYAIGDFTIGAAYEDQEDATAAITDVETIGVSGTYTFGNNTIGATYVMEEQDYTAGGDSDIDGWAINFNHDLSNRTAVYATYVDSENDDSTSDLTDDGADEYSGFTVGIVHSF